MRLTISIVLICAVATAMPSAAGPNGCPLGLAKKAVPCVPPGQVKNGYKGPKYEWGDVIRLGDFGIIRQPERYGLDPWGTFYASDGYVFRVNGDTREVLDLIGAVAAILD